MIRSRYTAAVNDKAWWLAGGIPQSACVAAYQAKGASSLTGSLINLARPGLYTAVNAGVNWYVDIGWDSPRNNCYITIDLSTMPTDNNKTIIVSGYLLQSSYLILDNLTVTYIRASSGRWRNSWSSYSTYTFPNAVNGVVALSGNKAYIDGSVIINRTESSGTSGTSYRIGSDNTGNTCNCYYYALAFYNTTLSDYQVAALTAAMNAL